jgi:hypothetical protein
MNNNFKLSKENIHLLLLEINKQINDYSQYTAFSIENDEVSAELMYPPGTKLTQEELSELKKLRDNSTLYSALKKLFADSNANIAFGILSLIDGVSDPSKGTWKNDGITLVDWNENIEDPTEMLHDELLAKYWEWKNGPTS